MSCQELSINSYKQSVKKNSGVITSGSFVQKDLKIEPQRCQSIIDLTPLERAKFGNDRSYKPNLLCRSDVGQSKDQDSQIKRISSMPRPKLVS